MGENLMVYMHKKFSVVMFRLRDTPDTKCMGKSQNMIGFKLDLT